MVDSLSRRVHCLSLRLSALIVLVALLGFFLWFYTAFRDREPAGILGAGAALIILAAVFLAVYGVTRFFLWRRVYRPLDGILSEMGRIGKGDFGCRVKVERSGGMDRLAEAVNRLGALLSEKKEALNRLNEEYRTLFQNAPCYITIQDREFKLLSYNKEFARSFDPQPGDTCYRAYKGRSERCPDCPLVGTLADGRPRTSEETGVNKEGASSHWVVRTSPIKNAEGDVIAAMEMSLDVTQMKFLEREVQQSEEKYRIIFNNVPNPIFVLDEETMEILDCNDSAVEVYRYTRGDLIGSEFLRLFEEGDRKTSGERIGRLEAVNRIRQVRGDGDRIIVNVYTMPGDYDQRKALFVTTSDVTARLIAERQLIQASKMATLGEMATGVAHELNQPLSVIKTASNFLLRKAREGEPVRDDIMETMTTEIDSHVDRASRIINHMREFGRQSDIKKSEVQVNEALGKALEIFSQQLKLREISVNLDLGEGLPNILADSNRLEQVFINLLTNARDAIEAKSQGRAYGPGEKKLFIRTFEDGGRVTIAFRDTGTGIPSSIRDRIFDPFFTTKDVGQGTGLGLSISYGIVRDYDGTIDVRSNEGEGATFLIAFPAQGERDG